MTHQQNQFLAVTDLTAVVHGNQSRRSSHSPIGGEKARGLGSFFLLDGEDIHKKTEDPGAALETSRSGSASRRQKAAPGGEEDSGKRRSIHRELAAISEQEQSKMRALFLTYDTEHNGSISNDNLVPLLTAMGHPMREDQAQELLEQVDVNSNGRLDYPEFLQLVRIFKDIAQFRMYDRDDRQDNTDASKFTVSPNSRALWAFDVLLLLTLSFIAISVTSLHTSGDAEEVYRNMRWFDVGDGLSTVVLAVQFSLRFFVATPRTRTTFRTDEEHLVASSLAYARTFMLFEVLAILPMRLFTSDAVTSIVLGHFRIFALVRFPAILDAPKVQSISPVYIQFFYVWAPVLKNLCLFLVLVHCFAVIGLRFIEGADTYAAAAYQMLYLISGAGFGDIRPVSSGERVFLSFMCILSMLVNGVVVGGIVSFLAQSDVEGMRRNRLLQTMAVLNFFEVPQTLQAEILQFQDHIMKKDLEVAFGYLTGHLPHAMKAGLTLQFRLALIQSVPVFARAHESTQVMLSQRLRPEVFRPETYVVLADETGDQMFFINYGFVDLFSAHGNYISTKAPGENFGSEAIFEPFKVIMSKSAAAGHLTPGTTPSAAYIGSLRAAQGTYTLSAKTITYVEVLSLDSACFAEVMEQFPRFRLDVETSVSSGVVSTAALPRDDESTDLRTPIFMVPQSLGLQHSDDDDDPDVPTPLLLTPHQTSYSYVEDPQLVLELEEELARELSALRDVLLPPPCSEPVPSLEITETSPDAPHDYGGQKEAVQAAPHPFDVDDEEL